METGELKGKAAEFQRPRFEKWVLEYFKEPWLLEQNTNKQRYCSFEIEGAWQGWLAALASGDSAQLIKMEVCLRDQILWLKRYLENYAVHVSTKDAMGNIVNGFAAVQIPDWAVRQKLDDIDFALSPAGGSQEGEPDVPKA